ncbi:MAG: NAD(P)/FAD-dependent oxidoreductase [Candidatus Latescibacterota bacterium]
MSTVCESEYDLIIVGAGPAGSTAALYASRLGLRSLLLDRRAFPRDKTCGDALSGKSVAVLHELGLLERLRDLRHAAIRRILFGSPAGVQASIELGRHPMHAGLGEDGLPMQGYVVARRDFDRFLLEAARCAPGVCAMEGVTVRDLVRQGDQVCGVRGHTRSGEEVVLRGSVVLGCDGFGSTVAHRSGLHVPDAEHRMVALRCYHEGVAGLTDQIELHFIDEALPGYFWIFPAGDGRANVGIGMDLADIRRRGVDLRQTLRRAVASPGFAERFAGARALEAPTGWNLPMGSLRRPLHGPGVLLVGDAAGLVDPFTGEGIGNALYSARLAARTVAAARRAGDYSARFLGRYERSLWRGLGAELGVSTRLHALARRAWLLNLVIGKAAHSAEVSDLIAGMMANAVPRQTIISPLFYLKVLRS